MLWLLEVSIFSSLFWYVSDWWECADIVRYMNISFCISEGWSLISPGSGTIDISVSVALIQFLKRVKLLIQYNTLQVHLVLTLVCMCWCRWTLSRTKERFTEGSLLWYKMVMIAIFLCAAYYESWCRYIQLCRLLPLCLCYCIDDVGIESLLIKR